jgi:transcriptional regulator with XRE-family HTH domain
MNVHEKIKLLRETKNWSQEDMAEKLNMSVNGYSKIERGETKPYNPKLEKIAEIFDIDLLELISANDKNVYLISDNSNNGCNVIGSSSEIAFEIQKLQMTMTHKDELIEQLRAEITLLKEVVSLMKKSA